MATQKEKEREFIKLLQAAEKAAAAAAAAEKVAEKAAAAATAEKEDSSRGAEERRCLDALSLLKFFPVADEVLVSTKVEQRIQTLIKKHPCRKIRGLAFDLCMMWANQRLDHAKKQKTATTAKTTSLLKNNNNNTTLLDKICQQRDKNRDRFYQALCKVYTEVDDDEDIKNQVNACDPVGVAAAMESAFFEKLRHANYGSIKGIMFKYRSVLFNIEDPKNLDFRRKVLLGQIKPENVEELSPDEMASDERHHENQKLEAKTLIRRMTGTISKGTTDQFKCGRCGKRETTYYQLQTRSADEPMTTYVTCVACSNHWRF